MNASDHHILYDPVLSIPWENTVDMAQQESTRHSVPRNQRRHIAWRIALFIVMVLAWASYDRHFPSWDEDVLLSDGRMIKVHRAHMFNVQGALIETSLTFDLPEMGGKRTWKERLYPAMVDVYQGQVYVVGDVTYRHASAYRDPKYGYVAYTYSVDGWRRVPFTSLPEAIRKKENVAGCRAAMSYRTWGEKQAGWCNLEDEFVLGASRMVDLAAREMYASESAEIRGTTTKPE